MKATLKTKVGVPDVVFTPDQLDYLKQRFQKDTTITAAEPLNSLEKVHKAQGVLSVLEHIQFLITKQEA